MTAQQRTLLNTVALLLALLWLLLIWQTIAPDVSDFQDYWQGATDLLRTGDPYSTQPGYIYPPLFVYLILPTGWLPHAQGQQLWFGLNVLILAGFLPLCIRASGARLAHHYWGLVVLGTVLIPPTRLCLQLGQIGILIAFLIVASFLLAPRKWGLAGALLAIASMIKLQPALVAIHYLLRPPRRVITWSIITTVLLLLLTLLPYGTAHYASYFQTIIQQGKYPYASEHTISLYGFASRLFSSNPFAVPVLDMPLLATVLTLVLSLGILAIGLWIGRMKTNEHGTLLQFCFWLCVSLVLWPANGYYNLSLLLLPLLAMLRYLEEHPDRQLRAWLIIATALLCIPPGWSKVHPALYQTLHMQWGVLLLTPALYGVLLYAGLLAMLVVRSVDTKHE